MKMQLDSSDDEITRWATQRYSAPTPTASVAPAAAAQPVPIAQTAPAYYGNEPPVSYPEAPAAASPLMSTATDGGMLGTAAAPTASTAYPSWLPSPSKVAENIAQVYMPSPTSVFSPAASTPAAPAPAAAPAYTAPVKPVYTAPTAPQTFSAPAATPAPVLGAASQIDQAALTHRTIDPNTETVAGQLHSVLAADSPILQQARADALRAGNERGMLNSAMTASGGEDAAIRAGLSIATPDAAAYGRASDYNAAADNQAVMWNTGQKNDFTKQQGQMDADAAARAAQLAQQFTVAQMQDAQQKYSTDTSSATSRYNADSQLGQQLNVAQMQDATTRFNAELNSANSRYNTDAQYRQQADSSRNGLVNNILVSTDMSPDRKAAMLEALGMGTSARNGQPGTGLAGAVYVIDSTGSDLNFSNGSTWSNTARQVLTAKANGG